MPARPWTLVRSRFLVCFCGSALPAEWTGPPPSRRRRPGSVGQTKPSLYRAMAFECQRANGDAPRSWRRRLAPEACGVPAAALAGRGRLAGRPPFVRQRSVSLRPPAGERKGENSKKCIFFASITGTATYDAEKRGGGGGIPPFSPPPGLPSGRLPPAYRPYVPPQAAPAGRPSKPPQRAAPTYPRIPPRKPPQRAALRTAPSTAPPPRRLVPRLGTHQNLASFSLDDSRSPAI